MLGVSDCSPGNLVLSCRRTLLLFDACLDLLQLRTQNRAPGGLLVVRSTAKGRAPACISQALFAPSKHRVNAPHETSIWGPVIKCNIFEQIAISQIDYRRFSACSSGPFCAVKILQRGFETNATLTIGPRQSLRPIAGTAAKFTDDVY